jgi:hypothetical protein
VCRGWRSVLLERSLWTRLELTAESGVRVHEGARRGALDALLRCAAARAGGGLHLLRVAPGFVTPEALLAVAAANAGALRELHGDPYFQVSIDEAEALCVAAPLLRSFSTELQCDVADVPAARRALRNEAPFGPLRVLRLEAQIGDRMAEADVVAFAADVAAHTSLVQLTLKWAPLGTPAALDAVVDAALARRFHTIVLHRCRICAASAPALTRLLGGDALTTLKIEHSGLLNVPAAAMLAAAFRANSTLTSLALDNVSMWRNPAAAAELLGALAGHASVRVLCLRRNVVATEHRAAVGAALGTLLAANGRVLTELDVSLSMLGDDGLRALFEALPRNTHLRKLKCSDNAISASFARDVLLPAVRANVSLRELDAGHTPYAMQAAALVRDRR